MIFKQEWLQRKVLDGLHQLTEIHIYHQENDKAEQYARRQLELEPWREKAHQQLMRVLALRGERTAALAQYEKCSRVLASEFEAEPSAETRGLFEEIRSGKFQNNEPPEQTAPTKALVREVPRAKFEITPTVWKRLLFVVVLVIVLVGAGSAILFGGFPSGQEDGVLFANQDIYDDFNIVNFDGAYDPGKWTERNETGANCEFVQQGGVLRISHDKPQLQSGCTLRIKRPLAVAGDELGSLSARMQLLDTQWRIYWDRVANNYRVTRWGLGSRLWGLGRF